MTMVRIAAALLGLCVCGAFAQSSSTVKLSVSVTDLSGAVLPEALVSATNEETGVSFDSRADSKGQADLKLPPGKYTLLVRCQGFISWRQEHVEADGPMRKKAALGVSEGTSPREILVIPTE